MTLVYELLSKEMRVKIEIELREKLAKEIEELEIGDSVTNGVGMKMRAIAAIRNGANK